MDKIIIAIDGHSSCGKSTFAKAIARKMGYIFIDTGAMYRAVTLNSIQEKYISEDNFNRELVIKSLLTINITFEFNKLKGKSDTYLNGKYVEDEIRTLEVSSFVSKISSIKEVREFLVELQQGMGNKKGIVMDGRDIGTTVFPSAEIKIFMTASADIRAERRYKELTEKGDTVLFEDIKQNIIDRDFQDENRLESPLRQANDAILLDNSDMTPEVQMDWISNLLKERGYDC